MTSARTVTEIIDVLQFARDLHKDCKNAGDDYAEISTEVRDLHTVLRHLRDEAREPQSVLNRDAAVYAKDLAPILKDCDSTLHSLDDLQRRYDGIRLRTGEADMLAEIRLRLINQRTRITRLLDAVQLRGKKAVPNNIDEIEHSRVLDIILDKVDVIAARMGGKTGSLMTTYENDDREVWKDFRRELIDEGFSREVVSKNEDTLRAYIREIDQDGGLDDEFTEPRSRAGSGASTSTEQWLERVHSPANPPPFDSLHSSHKEVPYFEDNSKFPQSIKSLRGRPDSGIQGIPLDKDDRGPPRLIPSSGDYKPPVETAMVLRLQPQDMQICTTDAILADDFEPSSRHLEPRDRRRRTSNQSDAGGSQQGSPVSPRSSFSFWHDGGVSRIRGNNLIPEGSLYGSSPRASGALPVPGANQGQQTHPNADRYGNSPKISNASSTLAPDSQGREIPLDAKWTRVRRDLISIEVLDLEGKRYEARPEFVAILGVLSRDDIIYLATRTLEHREARRSRANSNISSSPPPPVPPPRPGTASRAMENTARPIAVPPPRKSVKFKDEDSLVGSSDSGSSTSPDERDWDRDRRYKDRDRGDRDRNYRPHISTTYAHNGHGTPGSPPPLFSPGPLSPQDTNYYGSSSSPRPYYLAPGREGRDKRKPSPSNGDRDKDRRDKDRQAVRNARNDRNPQPGERHRWRDGLTAAGLGGAAASMLSVLADAAGDLVI